jgi:poly(hydroxyalkanoate) depolymerase family esterase
LKPFFLIPLLFAVPQIVVASPGQWSEHEIVALSGVLNYRLYLPASQNGEVTYKGAILGLHGCHENAADFAALTRLQDLADRENLLLVLPEQSPLLNSDLCWNWFLPVNQMRLGGEPEQFMSALQDALQNVSVPSDRVFVIGMSSGAIMANIMGSCYPEVFSGVAIHSGIQYAEPLKPGDALDGSMRCPSESSAIAGGLAFSCSGITPRKLPPVILFHGDVDKRVYPCNEDATFNQWIQMADWSDDLIDNGSVSLKDVSTSVQQQSGNTYSYTVTDLTTPTWRMRKVLVHGMAHAWSGGPVEVPYADPLGPDATQMLWDFFQEP